MNGRSGVGQALAELVLRLTEEQRAEFADALRGLRLESHRHVGEPKVYVATTSDGLALELPEACVTPFLERVASLFAGPVIEVYLRRNGRGEEHRISREDFAEFLNANQDVLQEGSLMVEFENATLVSGGGGCMLLTLEGPVLDRRSQIAREALQVCGFDHEFVGDRFTAVVWNDELEVSEQ